MILQCWMEIWANVCTYVCKMSDTFRNAISVALQLFIALSWHYKSDYWFWLAVLWTGLPGLGTINMILKQTMNM